MGANAQTSVPAFTAGQVLTAQQQTEINTGVPVFADATARNAAFGGSGEKVLAEGQLAYLEDSNIVQYYDGASWATVGPAADSGLSLISSTTIGSAVTSVALTNIFSATYNNYRIIISGGSASATSDGNFIFGATTANYYAAFIYNGYGASTPTGVATSNTANSGTVFAYSANGYNLDMTIYAPFLTARTSFTYISATMATTGNRWAGGGFQDSATSFTGMTFQTQGGHTLTGGTIKVYGFKN